GFDQEGRSCVVKWSSALPDEKSTSTADAAGVRTGSTCSGVDTGPESLHDLFVGAGASGAGAGALKVMASLACIQSGRLASCFGATAAETKDPTASRGFDFNSLIASKSFWDIDSSAEDGRAGFCSTSFGSSPHRFFFFEGR